MNQDERWIKQYDDVMEFLEKNHRNPSKYVDSERGLRNWVKQQKKLLNAGALEGQRLKMLFTDFPYRFYKGLVINVLVRIKKISIIYLTNYKHY